MIAVERLKRLASAVTSTRGAFEVVLVAATAATSALVTYRIASKRIEAEYAQKIDDELETTRQFYAAFHGKPSIAELVEDAGLPVIEEVELPAEDPRPDLELTGRGQKTQYNKVVKQYTGTDDPSSETVVEIPEEVHNVFAATDTLSQDEIDARGPHSPYLITQEEFTEGEGSQDTLTYYAEDGVLADSQDMPFDNVDRLVGEVNLQRFGVGSGDKRVVYVRNEAIDQDWEIVLHDGSYAEIVAGLKDEPETPRRRRSAQDE